MKSPRVDEHLPPLELRRILVLVHHKVGLQMRKLPQLKWRRRPLALVSARRGAAQLVMGRLAERASAAAHLKSGDWEETEAICAECYARNHLFQAGCRGSGRSRLRIGGALAAWPRVKQAS